MTTDLVAAPWLNQTLADGRYLILDLLGDGGMAHVYRAWDRRFRRDVAVKAIKSILMTDVNFPIRFQREITTVAGLQHAHILPVLDSGKHQGIPFAVFPFMAGGNLADRLQEVCPAKTGWLNAESLRWLVQVASALDFLHARNLFHRDVKPDNILFDAEGVAFLSDFGVVRVMEKEGGSNSTSVTAPNMVLGTCAYMAPELISGETDYNGAVDQYSLGVTLYEALAGEHPFKGSPQRIMVQHLQDEPKPLTELWSKAPKSLSDALEIALAKDPGKRFANCAALSRIVLASVAEASAKLVLANTKTMTAEHPGIDTLTPGEHVAAKRRRWLAALALLFCVGLLTGAMGAWFANGSDDPALPVAEPPEKPKPPPKTLTVSQNGSGDYQSISQAIQNSGDGDRILVKPGEYRESIVVVRDVAIIGDYERNDENRDAPSPIVIITQDGHCISMNTIRATIKGLTLRCQSSNASKLFHALFVSKGTPSITDCDMQSESHAVVAIRGRKTNPHFKNCRIHHASQSVGVYIHRGGRGVFESCSIFDNKTSGVTAVDGGNFIFRKCSIYKNDGYGVSLRDQEEGLFEDCNIFDNQKTNVRMDQSGAPTFRGCRIYGGKDYGIFIDGDTQGLFDDCHIYENRSDGVCLQERANAAFQKCTIAKGFARGLHIYKGARGKFENCDITDNAGAGVVVDEGISNPRLSNCKILNNNAEGVQVYQALGAFINCTIQDNKNSNVRIWGGSSPYFQKCTIVDSKAEHGVYIENSGGTFLECTINNRNQRETAGVFFQKGEARLKCTFRQCKINNNEIGVETKSDGDGLIVIQCDLTKNNIATRFPKNNKVQYSQNKE